MRYFGTVARGVRMPIIRQGDDLATIVAETIFQAFKYEKIEVKDKDIIALTESIVARAEGNYASSKAIIKDVQAKVGKGPVGFVFPILSRNRMYGIVKAVASAVDELIIQLSYPSDEVGNALISEELLFDYEINPNTQTFEEAEFRNLFGEELLHPITKQDYPSLYKSCGDNVKIIFSNDPQAILKYTNKVIAADVHSRHITKARLKQGGAELVLGLDDILTKSIGGSGYHPEYGLLGSNYASEDVLKLFPRSSKQVAEKIQTLFKKKTNRQVEVLVFGDGAFKDPVAKIWELADPVVAAAYTSGLGGTPHENKLKLLADDDFKHLDGEELEEKLKEHIKSSSKSAPNALGTTPRQISDLLGSLSDLMAGSGDKGTPVIYIQGYFDNYADE